jgi:hypothetical protein
MGMNDHGAEGAKQLALAQRVNATLLEGGTLFIHWGGVLV